MKKKLIDLDKWTPAGLESPKKRGMYLVMCGKRRLSWIEMCMTKAYWNGKTWDVTPEVTIIEWKHITSKDNFKAITSNVNNILCSGGKCYDCML